MGHSSEVLRWEAPILITSRKPSPSWTSARYLVRDECPRGCLHAGRTGDPTLLKRLSREFRLSHRVRLPNLNAFVDEATGQLVSTLRPLRLSYLHLPLGEAEALGRSGCRERGASAQSSPSSRRHSIVNPAAILRDWPARADCGRAFSPSRRGQSLTPPCGPAG